MQNNFDVTLDLPIISLCNYNCAYCSARRDIAWGKVASKKDIDRLIGEISKSKYRFAIDVSGGEPTLHPLWRYITTSLSDVPNVEKVRLTTNGSMLISGSIGSKTLLAYTWHYLADDAKFLDTVIHCPYPLEPVEVMMMPRHEERGSAVISALKGAGIKYHVPVIIGHSGNAVYNKFTTNDQEITKNLVNARSHKGELCRRSYIETDVEGNILTKCLPQVNIYHTNFISELDLTPVPCPTDKKCNVDGMLECLIKI